MPSSGNFAVNGFSGAESVDQESKHATQEAALVQKDTRDKMPHNDAQFEGTAPSWDGPLTVQESQQRENADPMEGLSPKDWEELEVRYGRDMEVAIQHEQSIIDEIEWVMQMMKESTIASSKKESERAQKRLHTRIAFVQQSEETLAEKRRHYKGVVDAFQNAMALLGGV